MTLQSRICAKLRARTSAKRLSQAALGRLLSHATGERWPQSRVWKLLHGELPLTIDMLDAVTRVLDLELLSLIADTPLPPHKAAPTAVRILALLQREQLLDSDVVVFVYRPGRPTKLRSYSAQPGENRIRTHDPS
jgi:transcriptional regulator with XRE-family HTH domain